MCFFSWTHHNLKCFEMSRYSLNVIVICFSVFFFNVNNLDFIKGFSMDIKQSVAERNFSKCYVHRCYLWNGKISNYNSLEPCPHGYWTLEIYDEEVQKEVGGFISWLIEEGKGRSSIRHYFVPLNISCENKTSCTWKHKNQSKISINKSVPRKIFPKLIKCFMTLCIFNHLSKQSIKYNYNN